MSLHCTKQCWTSWVSILLHNNSSMTWIWWNLFLIIGNKLEQISITSCNVKNTSIMVHTYLIHLCIHCKECHSNVNLNLFRRKLQKLSDVYMNMQYTFLNTLHYYFNILVWYSIINSLIKHLNHCDMYFTTFSNRCQKYIT